MHIWYQYTEIEEQGEKERDKGRYMPMHVHTN